MKYFDSHAHYYDDRFREELGESVDEFIGTLLSGNTSYIVNVGTSPATSRLAIEQAKRHNNMYVAIGIHPGDCQYLECDMEAAISDIENLILNKENKCVAIGEIGLDYHYPNTDKKIQARYFDAQMYLAEKLSLPVVIHDRDAHGDIMDIIRRHPNVRGVLHSYSGSVEMARELVSLGYMISFSGTLTFKNARKPQEVIKQIPKSSILIETDCPYLAPHPLRGSMNHSGMLLYTNAKGAELLGMSEEDFAKLTEDNAKRFFAITNRI